ncbi:hypothetical protein BLA24_14530 [Streptomyces cinnamoneus]|uniref:Uncharacterized protein n=1 Tax=Streptomyces cinnamoneus TaxID=53446 RepID=A0A2G1XIF0_STRCJ|nr:hypothetical protein [Streptomyces cinnamoneus]PHQ51003.1 hypothetical protein BLA24_14530 [Streptomyces cinnamoneus]PPT13775.1 hypothetical protein CYQ11_13545 [Streptomyces cinnamoneus]
MDEDEDLRLRAIAPEISRVTIGLMRKTVGLEPAERVPEEALCVADDVLAKHGTDGLRVLIMSLAGWMTVGIENIAHLTGKTNEAVVDDIELTCMEANPDG